MAQVPAFAEAVEARVVIHQQGGSGWILPAEQDRWATGNCQPGIQSGQARAAGPIQSPKLHYTAGEGFHWSFFPSPGKLAVVKSRTQIFTEQNPRLTLAKILGHGRSPPGDCRPYTY
jgi:hypothetical protein